MASEQLTADRLREHVRYDQKTGEFFRAGTGAKTGSVNKAVGYVYLSIDGRSYLAHRLAWLYSTGVRPNGMIDHINGNRLDNRFSNLRLADATINMQNRRGPSKRSKSGVLGVCWDRGRWVAHIMVNRKRKNLGRFDALEDARDAYLTAKREMHAGCTI